jgi:hypothetical protein
MAIFADGDAMHRFLQECPLTFEIDRTERKEDVFEDAPAQDHAEDLTTSTNTNPEDDELSHTSNGLIELTTSPPKPNPKQPQSDYFTRPQLFRVNADIWRGKHKDWLERHPFWGNFQPRKQSLVAQDLAKRVPLAGLVDIDVKGMKEIPIPVLISRKKVIGERPTVRQMIRDFRGGDETVERTSSGT